MTNLIESISSKASALAELAKVIGHPELLLEIANWKMQLADLKEDYVRLQNENLELKSQRQEDIDNPLSITQCGIYFDTHKNRYCAGCYDGPTNRRVHLVYYSANPKHVFYICPVCKIEYNDINDIGPTPFRSQRSNWSPI